MTDTNESMFHDAWPPRSIAGHQTGAFTLLVGVEDADLQQWLPSPKERFHRIPAAARGVLLLDEYTARARQHGWGLALECLGDSLHPSKHEALVAALRATGVPVIATTHAPDLVDWASFEEVLVCQGAVVRRLSDHPEADQWRKLLRAGEFWISVGEAWLMETSR